MATVARTLPPASKRATSGDAEPRVALFNIPWDTYLSLVKANGEGPVRFTYDRGMLEIMTLSRYHERLSRFLHRLVGALSEELGIEICSTGATTMHSDKLQRGAEADESFYIRHESLVRGHGREDFDPASPPDMAVEIDLSSDSSRRLPIYSALGIPEVWRYDGRRLTFQALRRGGNYHLVKRSLSFPKLAAADLERFLDKYDLIGESALVRQFRQWVRETMLPE
ncbi:MAG TPA: Uma2 family endonuclease [Pirellulales bacterium]|nr:Uma2 family endonuclease [Pirellulales bacterium]